MLEKQKKRHRTTILAAMFFAGALFCACSSERDEDANPNQRTIGGGPSVSDADAIHDAEIDGPSQEDPTSTLDVTDTTEDGPQPDGDAGSNDESSVDTHLNDGQGLNDEAQLTDGDVDDNEPDTESDLVDAIADLIDADAGSDGPDLDGTDEPDSTPPTDLAEEVDPDPCEGTTHIGNLVINDAFPLSTFCVDGPRFLEGNVSIIHGPTDLDGLECLCEISGNVSASLNATLKDFDGLTNIRFLGGRVSVSNMSALSSFDFPSATNVGGVTMNLTSGVRYLPGFDHLQTATASIEITQNSGVQTIAGFNELDTLTGPLLLRNNPALTTVSGFSTLTEIVAGNLEIRNNNQLTDLSGLFGIESVGGDVVIEGNDALTDAYAWTLVNAIGVGNITGSVTVSGNE